jgi:hypothetical protein
MQERRRKSINIENLQQLQKSDKINFSKPSDSSQNKYLTFSDKTFYINGSTAGVGKIEAFLPFNFPLSNSGVGVRDGQG